VLRKKATAAAAALAAAVLLESGVAVAPLAAQEPEPPRTLMPGRGVELTTARCVICHDAQHITRARLSREEWLFNVKNMIERGAPISAEEIPPIVEYLATYYNRDTPPPAAPPGAQSAAAPAADPAQALLTTHACIACHAVDRKLIGPAFRDIAQRYAGQSDAAALLSRRIREGGIGAWGQVPMPPHPQLSPADASALVQWILARN
jgi:sulfite dehydrogenase